MRQFLDTTVRRALIALLLGVTVTAATWFVVNFNLKVDSERTLTPTFASYFETCHGDSFNVSAPEITLKDRGFPVAYIYQQNIPLCGQDRQTINRTETQTETSWLLAGVNVLMWTVLIFGVINRQSKYDSRSNQVIDAKVIE